MERVIKIPRGIKVDVAKVREKYPDLGINAVHTLLIPDIEAVLKKRYGADVAIELYSIARPNGKCGSKIYVYVEVRGNSEIEWASVINEVYRQHPEYAGCIRLSKEKHVLEYTGFTKYMRWK